jgi:hypothetical protein
MLDKTIEQLVGCYTQVLKPKRIKKPIGTPTIIALDTEFDDKGLISLCLAWQDQNGDIHSKIIYSNKPTIEIEELTETILDFCVENNIPVYKTVYLISHFAQSELQHIPDLWKKLKIRVIHKSMFGEYDYQCSGQLETERLQLKIIDSFSHFLCGLDKIAKAIGSEKVSLEGIGSQPEVYWKQNMRELLKKYPEIFEKYARQDSEVLIKAWNERRKFFLKNFGLDILHDVTLAQTSQKLFTSKFLKNPVEPIKHEWTSHYRKQGENWKLSWSRKWVYNGSRDKRYFAMKCYWGGRREAFYRGLINAPVEIWDVKQMYPTMAKLPLPNQNTEWVYLEGKENLDSTLDGIGFVYCKFKFPQETDYPCLPVYDSRFPKLVFPLKGESWATTYELKLATKMNCEISELKAWVFYPSKTEKNHPLKRFMEHFSNLKNQYPEGSMPYMTSKLLMNALIGKFCQRDPEYSFEFYQNLLSQLNYDYEAFREIMKSLAYRQKIKNPINVGSCWSPEWSSLILGSSRAIISEIMATSKAITGHTDSVIIFKGSKTECEATRLLKRLGSNLEHKNQYDSKQFWICRSAVYSPIRNGIHVKPTHHGYPTNHHECFGCIVKLNMKHGHTLCNQTFKTHLTTPKEALKTGAKLGSHTIKITNINWGWDYKRKLLKPKVNLWKEKSPTKPWRNIKEILQALNKTKPSNQKWKNTTQRGRPNKLTSNHISQIVKLRRQGLSIREIAQNLNLSKDSVHRLLR